MDILGKKLIVHQYSIFWLNNDDLTSAKRAENYTRLGTGAPASNKVTFVMSRLDSKFSHSRARRTLAGLIL